MATSGNQNGIPARRQSQYSVAGGRATPQLISTRPDSPSNLPISVVYWGYWKPTGTVYTVPGSVIASESMSVFTNCLFSLVASRILTSLWKYSRLQYIVNTSCHSQRQGNSKRHLRDRINPATKWN